MCGEQPVIQVSAAIRAGSPPRVRGTAFSALISVNRRRITPACAGNRAKASCPGAGGQDHPRVCGEQSASLSRASAVMGSPPRVRGTVFINPINGERYRITPACAGNSFHQLHLNREFGDHPRVCGEQEDQIY